MYVQRASHNDEVNDPSAISERRKYKVSLFNHSTNTSRIIYGHYTNTVAESKVLEYINSDPS